MPSRTTSAGNLTGPARLSSGLGCVAACLERKCQVDSQARFGTAEASLKDTGHSLHVERFGRPDLLRTVPEERRSSPGSVDEVATSDERTDPEEPFEVELAASGKVITVGRDQTILSCVRSIRQGLTFSCSEGSCGTCETAVLAGAPDHRDTVLSDDERASNATMMICVGRSRSARLVLDL